MKAAIVSALVVLATTVAAHAQSATPPTPTTRILAVGTIVAGTGGTLNGSGAVATVSSRSFLFNFTNVTIGQEAYTVYSKGAGTF